MYICRAEHTTSSKIVTADGGSSIMSTFLLRSDGSCSSAVVKRWEAAEVKTTQVHPVPSLGIGGAVEEWGLDLELPCLLGGWRGLF
jgi:hypothetical protein